jgi:hypothetical protein
MSDVLSNGIGANPADYDWNPWLRYRRVCGRHLLIDISSSYRIIELSPKLARLVENMDKVDFPAAVESYFAGSCDDPFNGSLPAVLQLLTAKGVLCRHAD